MERIALGNEDVLAFGLNDAGVVVGTVLTYKDGQRVRKSFRLMPGGYPEVSHGERPNDARGVNERGEIIGARYSPDGLGHAVKRGVSGRVQPLVPSVHSSQAYRLNNRGDVVGKVTVTGHGVTRAFVAWHQQPAVVIDKRGAPEESSMALGVNDRRQVVGDMSWGPWHEMVLFYWDVELDAPVKLLSLLDPDDPLRDRIISLDLPVAINNAGQVMATARDADSVPFPVLLTPLAAR